MTSLNLQGEMNLFVYGNQHRDPQLVKVQRMSNCGIFHPKCNVFIILPPPRVQGSLLKKGLEDHIKPEAVGDGKETLFSVHNRDVTHMSSIWF